MIGIDNKITFMDMSGMYSVRENILSSYASGIVQTEYIDCRDICGTECYCDDRAQETIRELIREHGITADSVHFIDNGNYHYLSKIMLEQMDKPFNLLVLDNHPDMQSPLFGPILSCGSWVKDMLDDNRYIRKVLLCGVKEELITEQIRQTDKVVICTDTNKVLELSDRDIPLYISIDKDVLDTQDYITNWDQGIMRIEELEYLVRSLIESHNVCGADICGGMNLPMLERASQQDIELNNNTDIRILRALGIE